jgi:hypothetical protein
MIISDKNILHLIDILIFEKKVKNTKQFCEQINLFQQTVVKIRKEEQHFTPVHIHRICKIYNVNANWVFGLSDTIFNQVKPPVKSMVLE